MGKRGQNAAFKADPKAAAAAIAQMRKISAPPPGITSTPSKPVTDLKTPESEANTPAPAAATPGTACTTKSKLACY